MTDVPAAGVEVVIGLDVGGTKVRAGLGTPSGELLAVDDRPTERADADALVRQLADLASTTAGERWADVRRIGVGVPGVFDASTGRTARCPNVPALAEVDLPAALSAATGRDVAVDNDGTLAAVAEHRFGDGQGVADLVVLSVGTGVGAGIISGGRPVRGHRGAAGEIADLPLGLTAGAPSGGLESQVGTPAVVARYAAAGGTGTDGVREILDRAAAGEIVASRLLDDVADELGAALAAVVALLDPALILLTGGIGSHPDVVHRVGGSLRARVAEAPVVRAGAAGERAGVLGAVALALAGPAGSAPTSDRPGA